MMLMLEGGGEAISDEAVKKRLNSNPQFAALLEQLGATAPMKLSPTTGKRTYAFAKTDEAFTAMLDHDDPMVVAAVTARLGNKSSIEETRTLALLEIASRGALPFPLKYCGAAVTHRFSAWDGVNLQNLPRGGNLRRAIIAPKGYKIVAADLSNIELRLGLWLAGQEDKLQLIRQGRDLYMDVAAQMYGKSYEDIQALGKKSAERTCGKVVSLSSIYGTGAAKLQETLRLVGKVKVTGKFCEDATYLYRGTYTRVVDAWREGKDVLDTLYQKNNYGVYLKVLNVTAEGMVKPSGLVLTYPDLRLDLDDKGRAGYTYEQKRGARDRVYGSKCMQRATQSLARDIICEHMLQIDKKYHVVGTVHDEVVCVLPEDEVEEAKAFMLEVMRTPPWWAPDLPLDAEVGVGDNYADAK
jgi:DNA polymerase